MIYKTLEKEEFEDPKGVIIIRISKNRQHSGKKKTYKRTNRSHNPATRIMSLYCHMTAEVIQLHG